MKLSNSVLKIVVLVIITLLTAQCSTDYNSESTTSAENLLIGNWTISNVSVEGKVFALGESDEYWGWVFSPYPIHPW